MAKVGTRYVSNVLPSGVKPSDSTIVYDGFVWALEIHVCVERFHLIEESYGAREGRRYFFGTTQNQFSAVRLPTVLSTLSTPRWPAIA